jgi:hypothetical protein
MHVATRSKAHRRAVPHAFPRRAWEREKDLDRTTADKTSSVHFLRFELNAEQRAAVKAGASIGVGIDHAQYSYQNMPLAENLRASLAADIE